jgi:hypothetical protein
MGSELSKLKEDLKEYKRLMKLTRPLAGYLGNQYLFWHQKHSDTLEKINDLKLNK